jgi:putative transposase
MYPLYIDTKVVLPGYLHAVWTLPKGSADYPARWALIKTGFLANLLIIDTKPGGVDDNNRSEVTRRINHGQ